MNSSLVTILFKFVTISILHKRVCQFFFVNVAYENDMEQKIEKFKTGCYNNIKLM